MGEQEEDEKHEMAAFKNHYEQVNSSENGIV
jgi:hypothetical protein